MLSGLRNDEFTVEYDLEEWAGLDLNQRRLSPAGLQPAPFSRSGTDPFRCIFTAF